MATYALPGLTDSQAGQLAGTFGATGEPFTLSPVSGGYSLDSSSSTIGAMVQSAFSGMASSNASATGTDNFLSDLENNFGLDTGVTAAPSSNVLGGAAATPPASPDSSDDSIWGKFIAWLNSEGSNILAVVVGLVFLGLGVYGMVNK